MKAKAYLLFSPGIDILQALYITYNKQDKNIHYRN